MSGWLFGKKKDKIKNVDLIIAGLGNPGNDYLYTRHNIGWMVADKLAEQHEASFEGVDKLYDEVIFNIAGKNVLLIKPITYMNRSGAALRKAISQYELVPEQVLIIVDEYNFPVGKIHLKKGGGDGGHNGIASVIDELDSQEFYRLRCGIGKNFGPGGLVDYVLSPFDKDEADEKESMVEKAAGALDYFTKVNPTRAMSDINSGSLWKKEDDK